MPQTVHKNMDTRKAAGTARLALPELLVQLALQWGGLHHHVLHNLGRQVVQHCVLGAPQDEGNHLQGEGGGGALVDLEVVIGEFT